MSDTQKLTIEIEFDIDGDISAEDAKNVVYRSITDRASLVIQDENGKWDIIIDSFDQK